MTLKKSTTLIAALLWLACSILLTSSNLVLCFGNTHTALEFQHSPEGIAQNQANTLSNSADEVCVDVPLNSKVDFASSLKLVVAKENISAANSFKIIRNLERLAAPTPLLISRQVDEFISSVRLII